jgi:hypothetical protein
MKYLCLGYYDPSAFDGISAAEQEAIAAECRPHDERLYATGRVVTVASLAHRKAVAIRPGRKTGPTVTDGPYAEAKEVIGSFFIVEADDVDEAVRLASLHPAAQWGEHLGFGIEVRPIDYWMVPER